MNDQKSTLSGGAIRLEIQAEGPKVGQARLSAGDFAEIVRRTQQALKRIGQVLYGQQSNVHGRKSKDIEQQCELFMVGGAAKKHFLSVFPISTDHRRPKLEPSLL